MDQYTKNNMAQNKHRKLNQ